MSSTYEVRARTVTEATVRPPGSKSITNRALVAAALATGESNIDAPLRSDDTEAMVGGLRALGVTIVDTERGFQVGSEGSLDGAERVDAHASGTTARFLTAVATLASGSSVIDGTPRMRERPIGELVAALRGLGARLSTGDDAGYPPVFVEGGGLDGGFVEIDVSRSSQFASAVLLVAPRAQRSVTLEMGADITSRPYLDTTLEVMAAFGAHAAWNTPTSITVMPDGYRSSEFMVEADASAAVYAWSAAAITGATITVAGIDPASSQADMGALAVLENMGCDVRWTLDGITVSGPERLSGVSVDMNQSPDAVLAMSVVAAFAKTETRIHNVANLRLKETDRLAALEAELTKLGAEVATGPDWIRINPRLTRPTDIATYDDHRMAMSFAVAGLRQPGIVIEDPECVSKTWPDFFQVLESL